MKTKTTILLTTITIIATTTIAVPQPQVEAYCQTMQEDQVPNEFNIQTLEGETPDQINCNNLQNYDLEEAPEPIQNSLNRPGPGLEILIGIIALALTMPIVYRHHTLKETARIYTTGLITGITGLITTYLYSYITTNPLDLTAVLLAFTAITTTNYILYKSSEVIKESKMAYVSYIVGIYINLLIFMAFITPPLL